MKTMLGWSVREGRRRAGSCRTTHIWGPRAGKRSDEQPQFAGVAKIGGPRMQTQFVAGDARGESCPSVSRMSERSIRLVRSGACACVSGVRCGGVKRSTASNWEEGITPYTHTGCCIAESEFKRSVTSGPRSHLERPSREPSARQVQSRPPAMDMKPPIRRRVRRTVTGHPGAVSAARLFATMKLNISHLHHRTVQILGSSTSFVCSRL